MFEMHGYQLNQTISDLPCKAKISACTFFPAQLIVTEFPSFKGTSFSVINRVGAMPVFISCGKRNNAFLGTFVAFLVSCLKDMFQAITHKTELCWLLSDDTKLQLIYTVSFKRWIKMLNFWLDTGYLIVLLFHAFCASNSLRLMSLPQTMLKRHVTEGVTFSQSLKFQCFWDPCLFSHCMNF